MVSASKVSLIGLLAIDDPKSIGKAAHNALLRITMQCVNQSKTVFAHSFILWMWMAFSSCGIVLSDRGRNNCSCFLLLTIKNVTNWYFFKFLFYNTSGLWIKNPIYTKLFAVILKLPFLSESLIMFNVPMLWYK